jgi:hypothetical protein
MTPRVFRAIGLGIAAAALAVPGVWAGPPQAGAPRPSDVVTARSGAGAVVAARATSILGSAWHADNTPIPHARLRLRNAVTGRIEATAVANEVGRFAFSGIESGTYVIELVSEQGKVLALGHLFTVAPGETVATFVRLGAQARWFNGFFSNAAAAAASTAAATGITAIAPERVRAVSPQR